MKTLFKPRKPKTKRKGKPDPVLLAEIVRRIVEASQPDEIYLFGSAARGEMDEHSDFDFLVVKSGKFHQNKMWQKIYFNIQGIASVDLVVARSQDVDKFKDYPALVYHPALREGVRVNVANDQ